MTNRTAVDYMERSRVYYAAQGYDTPYQWAHYDDLPFHARPKPLDECTITVVTTAMPMHATAGRDVGSRSRPAELSQGCKRQRFDLSRQRLLCIAMARIAISRSRSRWAPRTG